MRLESVGNTPRPINKGTMAGYPNGCQKAGDPKTAI